MTVYHSLPSLIQTGPYSHPRRRPSSTIYTSVAVTYIVLPKVTLQIQILTEEFAVDLVKWFALGKAIRPTFVTSNRSILVKIQSCFVRMKQYSYFLQCSVWSDLSINFTLGFLHTKHLTNGNQDLSKITSSCSDTDSCF